MRITFISLILIILPICLMSAQSNEGEYGFQFLQIPINPISAALAGNGIYADNYSGAYLMNPAANLIDENFSLSLNHAIWLVDTNCTQIIYSKGTLKKHFGLSARILDYGQLDTRDDTGAIIGNFHPIDANLMTNFAYRVTPNHMVGINIGILYEKIESASSYGINSDIGYIYLPPIANSILFASVRNLGVTSKMENEAIELPLIYEAGIGYKIKYDLYTISPQIAFNKSIDNDIRYTVATQFNLWDIIAFRLGYKINYSDEDLTAGIGINWQDITVNYGWASFSDKLNDTHSFGVTYNF